MTDATARREAKQAAVEGFCGFCAAHSMPLEHKRTCKLVKEHGGRISLKVMEVSQ